LAYQEHARDARQIAARCAIITLSDTRTPDTDKSGKKIRELLEATVMSSRTIASFATSRLSCTNC